MADKVILWRGVRLLAHDNGDNTYSLGTNVGNVTLSGADIELGAVEIKDGTTDTRVKVKSDGTDNALVVMMNPGAGIQGIDPGDADQSPTGNPLVIGVLDGDGFVKFVRGEADGSMRVRAQLWGLNEGDNDPRVLLTTDDGYLRVAPAVAVVEPTIYSETTESYTPQLADGTEGISLVSLGAVLAQDVGTKTSDGQGIAATPGLRLVGFSVTENAGSPAAASFTLRHGTGSGDPRLCPTVKLTASQTLSRDLPGAGAAAPNGVYVDWISGSIDLILYYRVVL